MDPFEYIVVLSSLILGLGIAQILTGAADMVSHLSKLRLSIPHSLMVIVVFLVHIHDWWVTYYFIDMVRVWTLPKVIGGLLVFPILLFVLARMLFPTGLRSHETDLHQFYFDQWVWFFLVFAATIVISILQNMILLGLPLSSQWILFIYLGSYLVFLIFRFKDERVHIAFHVVQLIAWMLFLIQDKTVLIIT